ncbi:hypothetical protein F4677DRAFT_446195 [Hypoxylon crocopeplum]|nr:hypothetical protein F4677DRAFT_446195 [Hypoxylon crocopeplum]
MWTSGPTTVVFPVLPASDVISSLLAGSTIIHLQPQLFSRRGLDPSLFMTDEIQTYSLLTYCLKAQNNADSLAIYSIARFLSTNPKVNMSHARVCQYNITVDSARGQDLKTSSRTSSYSSNSPDSQLRRETRRLKGSHNTPVPLECYVVFVESDLESIKAGYS